MVTELDVERFINSDLYEAALVEAKKIKYVMEYGINYDADKNDRGIFDKLLEYDIRDISIAHASIGDLENILKNDLSVFIKYVITHMDRFSDAPDEQEGKDDDDDELVEILPYYKEFLVMFLLEYFLLKNHPDKLENYMNERRIPYAKKYVAQLKKIYKSL